jgi:hypothetical protein
LQFGIGPLGFTAAKHVPLSNFRSWLGRLTGFIRFIPVVALIECQLPKSCLTFYVEKGFRLGLG